MLVFAMKCIVNRPIHAEDAEGRDVQLESGTYQLRGLEHLVKRGERTYAEGMDLLIESEYRIAPEKLAGLIASGDIELTV